MSYQCQSLHLKCSQNDNSSIYLIKKKLCKHCGHYYNQQKFELLPVENHEKIVNILTSKTSKLNKSKLKLVANNYEKSRLVGDSHTEYHSSSTRQNEPKMADLIISPKLCHSSNFLLKGTHNSIFTNQIPRASKPNLCHGSDKIIIGHIAQHQHLMHKTIVNDLNPQTSKNMRTIHLQTSSDNIKCCQCTKFTRMSCNQQKADAHTNKRNCHSVLCSDKDRNCYYFEPTTGRYRSVDRVYSGYNRKHSLDVFTQDNHPKESVINSRSTTERR